MYHKFGYIALGLCGGLILVAANYDTISHRSSDSTQSYGRLLSNAYRVIVNHEKHKGTFSNIDYFTSQANSVANFYNPRPLTTGGLVHNVKNRNELRLERFELERFMNGYAGRVASDDVAMMHAAFDCRVRNIEINPSMDKECQQIFIKHKNNADIKVKQYLNNRSVVQYTPPLQPKASLEQVKPVLNQQTQKTLPVIQKESVTAQESNEQLPKPKPIQEQNNTSKFNPLNYLHPSLREQEVKIEQQNKETIKIEAKTEPEKPVEFGIKPTTPVSVYDDTLKISPFKPSLNDNPVVPQEPEIAPTANASVGQPKAVKVNIPFSESLTIMPEGKKQLNMLVPLLKQGQYRTITIIGHADKGNNDITDVQMSVKRANHIKNSLQSYIQNNNINIISQGIGSNQPLSGMPASDDRNRRTEIILE
jgi:outer membrane protein OmpA-like peptidoglycan-associated protein